MRRISLAEITHSVTEAAFVALCEATLSAEDFARWCALLDTAAASLEPNEQLASRLFHALRLAVEHRRDVSRLTPLIASLCVPDRIPTAVIRLLARTISPGAHPAVVPLIRALLETLAHGATRAHLARDVHSRATLDAVLVPPVTAQLWCADLLQLVRVHPAPAVFIALAEHALCRRAHRSLTWKAMADILPELRTREAVEAIDAAVRTASAESPRVAVVLADWRAWLVRN